MPVVPVNQNLEIIPDLPPSLASNDAFSSPIIIRQLTGKIDESGDPTFLGTVMTGSFICDDTRDDSHMVFITAWRDGDANDIGYHYSGYGIALRMLTSEGQADGKLSIFVVDNSLADRSVVLENRLHTGWGDYAYLQATSYNFTAGTQYNFQLKFLSNGGLDFYVCDPSTGSLPGTPTISYGAYTPQSSGSYYGISCSNTGGYQTRVLSFSLSNLDDSYAMFYASLKADLLPSEFSAVAYAWAGLSDLSANGITMYVYDHILGDWDPVNYDEHYYGAGSSPSIRLEIEGLTKGQHADANSFVDLLLISKDHSDFATSVDVNLYVDSIYLEAYSTDVVHQGGATDAWIHDDDGFDYQTLDITSIGSQEWMTSDNASITAGSLVLPIMLIKEIVTIDGAGNELVTLTPLVDWEFIVYKEDLRFSAREENYIEFRTGLIGSNVRVKYYTFEDIATADIMLQSLLNKPTAYDVMARSMIPYDLFITIDIVGSLSNAEIINHIYEYIMNTHHISISMSDINIYLQGIEGIDDANVTALSAQKHELDGSVTPIASSGGSISLTNTEIEQFVTVNDTAHVTVTVS